MLEKIFLYVMCLIGLCGVPQKDTPEIYEIQPHAESGKMNVTISEDGRVTFYNSNSVSGNYLAGQFAQRHHDWKPAVAFFDKVLSHDPSNAETLNRTMILAMGSGDPVRAIELSHKVKAAEGEGEASPLASMFLALENFKTENYAEIPSHIADMPSGSLSDFMMPLLESWTAAANGEYKVDNLYGNTIHLYHAFLIGDFLEKREAFEPMLMRALAAKGLSVRDLERAGDVYTLLSQHDKALKIYEEALSGWPENKDLMKKVETLQNGETPVYFKSVESAEDGMALALQDMTQLLFNEQADDSARVFGNMALYLNADLSETHLLLGYIAARNGRRDIAIDHYKAVTEEDENYAKARRMAADLQEETGDIQGAVKTLEQLYDTQGDIDSLIQSGDIYRRHEDFKQAVKTYERAAGTFKNGVPPAYWHLFYVRGMSYERLGNWKNAEKDLLKALEYKPEHPLVLNYLGYAWADRGENLDRALDMIKKAVTLEPQDGYITDSLGWVHYRMQNYDEAVVWLEEAVALMPYDPIINDHLGDAYWKSGRKLEARFQWERARNYAEDDNIELVSLVDRKIKEGLTPEIEKLAKDVGE